MSAETPPEREAFLTARDALQRYGDACWRAGYQQAIADARGVCATYEERSRSLREDVSITEIGNVIGELHGGHAHDPR